MNTSENLTVVPILVAFFRGLMNMPMTDVVLVKSRGMGFEHEQPWRSKQLWSAFALGAGFRRPALAAIAALILAVFLDFRAALLAAPAAFGTLTESMHAGEFIIGERPDGGSRENVTVLSGQNLVAGAVVGRVKYGIGRVSIPTVVGTGTGTASAVFAGPDVEVGNYVLTCITAVAHGGVFSLTTPSGKALPNFTMTAGSGTATSYTSRHINFTITDSTDFIVGDVFTFVVSTTAPTVIGGTGTGVLTLHSLGPDAMPGNYRIINRAAVSNGGDFEVIAPNGASIGRFLMGTSSTGTAAFTSRQVNFSLTDATDFILGNYFDLCVFNQLSGGKAVAWDPTTFDGRHRVAGVLLDAVNATSGDLPGVRICRGAAVTKAALTWGAAISTSEKESAYKEMADLLGIVAR